MIKVELKEKSYGNKVVLKDISFQLISNKIHGLIGENGAGKTTLFECLTNLTKYKGTISLNNDIRIGYLPTSLFFYSNMKGIEYIEFCQSARKIKTNKDLIFELNQVFDLPLEEYAVNYSTGMKKKLAFMALLTQKNNLLLLDEPFNGLDLSSCLILKRILLNLKEKHQSTILISSHIISSLTDISDQIFLLGDGTLKHIYEKADYHSIEEEIMNSTLNSKLQSINNIIK